MTLDEARRLIGALYHDAHAKAANADSRIDGGRAWVHRGREEAFAQALGILNSRDDDPFAGLPGVPSRPTSEIGLPTRLVRVEALVGYGWPAVTYRRKQGRNFPRPADAARWVAALQAWPLHHQLLGLYRSDLIGWTALTTDDLPAPSVPEELSDDE